ncbi:MAG TPA: SCO family protein [Burkholderiaceae bacterium]|nr:SCO family protein [Burkholderiaceae bacterium]
MKLPTTTRRVSLVAAATLVLLLVAAVTLSWRWLRPAPAPLPHFVEVAAGAYVLPKPDALAEFRLVKHDDTVFDIQSLKGRWTFLIFGYTFCPDFCPTTLVEFAQMHRQLAQRPQGTRDVQFVMISVDPDRDTPQLLGRYVPQFNREFIGVTGDPAVIKQLADSVGAVYARAPGSSDSNYLIDHSTAVLLINPDGKLQGVFAAPHVAKDMVQAFAKMREP